MSRRLLILLSMFALAIGVLAPMSGAGAAPNGPLVPVGENDVTAVEAPGVGRDVLPPGFRKRATLEGNRDYILLFL